MLLVGTAAPVVAEAWHEEPARRIGLHRMRDAIKKLDYGTRQIGDNVTTFLSRLALQTLSFPRSAQQPVAVITTVDSGPGWSLQAKTGWQNAPAAGGG